MIIKIRYSLKIFRALIGFAVLFASCASGPYREELVETYYNLGNAYSDLGNLKDSAAAYSRAVQLDPSFPNASYNLGIVYIQTGDYKRGIKVLRGLMDQEPENIQIMKVLAWGLFKSGDIPGAVEIYRQILEIDSYNSDALKNITILLMDLNLFEDAYDYLLQIEALGSEDALIYFYLGSAERELAISTGLKWFDMAFKYNPSSEEYMEALVEALEDERDYGRAVEVYESLTAVNPDPLFLFNEAFILLTALEDYNKGLSVLSDALDKGFSDMERIEELKTFPDLLDRESILEVFMTHPLQTPEGSPGLPSGDQGVPVPGE